MEPAKSRDEERRERFGASLRSLAQADHERVDLDDETFAKTDAPIASARPDRPRHLSALIVGIVLVALALGVVFDASRRAAKSSAPPPSNRDLKYQSLLKASSSPSS